MLPSRIPAFLAVALSAWAQTGQTTQEPRDPSSVAATAIYRQILEDAEQARKQGQLKEALAAFRSVAERKDNEVPPDMRARAVSAIVSIDGVLDKQNSSPWRVIYGSETGQAWLWHGWSFSQFRWWFADIYWFDLRGVRHVYLSKTCRSHTIPAWPKAGY